MKRALPWGIAVACLGLAAWSLWLRGPQMAPGTTGRPTTAETAAVSAEEKIAYTFEDDAKMREFTDLWQQRQGFVIRMTVLQNYWNVEQAALAKVNSDLQATYSFDSSKNYTLESDKRQLLEREVPAPQLPETAQAAATAPSPKAPSPATPPSATSATAQAGATPETKVVHTFASDEELKSFAAVWQQRQASIVRMAVLQAYAREEQTGLTQVNDKLASTYHLDSTKDYRLDSKRRLLIEHPSPPTNQPVAPVAQAAPPSGVPPAPTSSPVTSSGAGKADKPPVTR